MEKDTPGQILGVTFKSDGKSSSSSEPVSDKFTQRPTDEDSYYEEHDIKETKYYKQREITPGMYFLVGFVMIFFLTAFLFESKKGDYINYERDLALARQKQQKDQSFDEA